MAVPKIVGDSALWKNIFSERRIKEGSTEEVLRNMPAFAELNARDIKEVAAIVHRREYRAGEPVFAQGDPGLGMYIIQNGEVAIMIEDKEGQRRELAVLSEGDFFGELGLLDESPRSASAVARTDCLLIGFFRPDLFELIEKKAHLGIRIVLELSGIVAARLRKADMELSRLKHQLELLQSKHGGRDGKETTT